MNSTNSNNINNSNNIINNINNTNINTNTINTINNTNTHKKRTGIIALLTVICVMALPITSMAQQSPDFAKTAEQWAVLRDDVLTFDEIPELIHEYNPTVLINANKYRSEKDQTSTDIAQSYYDTADKISDNLTEPEPDSANYASQMSQYLNQQIQMENLYKQGDTNTNDSETIKLGYDKQEAELTKQAETLMINYWTQIENINSLQNSLETAQSDLSTVRNKYTAGTALQYDLTNAEQKVTSAQAQLQSAQSTLESTKEQLILMLGWSYGANVTISPLASITPEQIAAIDLASDIETAKANNYTYKTTCKQYNNAVSSETKRSLAITKENAEKNISGSVTSLYNALMLAQSNYNQAAATLSNSSSSLATAKRKLEAGMMTQKTYDTMVASQSSSNSSLEKSRLSLINAYNNYKWAVNGLANN